MRAPQQRPPTAPSPERTPPELYWRLARRVRDLLDRRQGGQNSVLRRALRKVDSTVLRHVLRYRSARVGPLVLDTSPAVLGMVRMLRLGEFEPFTTRHFEERVHPGMNVVDGGANFGLYSLLAAKALRGQGTVWAFEPNPYVFRILVRNTHLNGVAQRIEPHRLALGSGPGEAELLAHLQFTGTGHLAPAVGPRDSDLGVFPVRVESLDGFFGARAWPRVDLVKLDVEGTEPRVLDGMTDLARRNPSLEVLLEISPPILRRQGFRVIDVVARLQRLGLTRLELCELPQPVAYELPDQQAELVAALQSQVCQMVWCRK